MYILAIDPGITTGYVLAKIENRYELHITAWQQKNSVLAHWILMHAENPDIIVIEDFTYRGRQKDKVILYPVELIGVTSLYGQMENIQVHRQTPATGKSFYSDEQLKRLHAHQAGTPHAMDAMRHLFQWLTFGPGFQYIDPDNAMIAWAPRR